ncbi:c-type cytochrome [Coralliovum pocilloporae]|uniref:c-type cytochrome n=1 Tax=Coralliovum pocilloporae TaxID=3066369 RepID=UPI00330732A4
MARIWRAVLAATGLLCSFPVLADDVDVEHLRNMVIQDCGSCHGLTLKGGLGRPLLPQAITHLDEETLRDIILDGLPETAMPPWRGLLTEADAAWIATALKNGTIR